MRKLYICAPLAGNIKENVERVKRAVITLVHEAEEKDILNETMFLVPHFALRGISFNLTREIDRVWGMKMCRELVAMSDMVIVLGKDISPGMEIDIETAHSLDRPVIYRRDL